MQNKYLNHIAKIKLQYDLERNKFNVDFIAKFQLLDRLDVFEKLKNKNQTTTLFKKLFHNEVVLNSHFAEGITLVSLSLKIKNNTLTESLFKEMMTGSLQELYFLKQAIIENQLLYSNGQDESDFIDTHYSGFSINFMPFTDLGNNRKDDNIYILMYDNFKKENCNYESEEFDIIKEQGFKNVLLCLSHINIFYYLENYQQTPDSFIDTLCNIKNLTTMLFPVNQKEIEHYFATSFIDDFINQSLCHSIFNLKEKGQHKKHINNLIYWDDSYDFKSHAIIIGTTASGCSNTSPHAKYTIWDTLYIFNELYSQDKIKKIFNIEIKTSLFKSVWNISFLNYQTTNKNKKSQFLLSGLLNTAPVSCLFFEISERNSILECLSDDDKHLRSAIIQKTAYHEKEIISTSLSLDQKIHTETTKKKRI